MYIYDSDIRKILYSNFLQEKKFIENPEDTIIIDEFSGGYSTARIDISVLNGSFHGYEIKSERDTLERLPNQIEYYRKIFEYITIVTTEKYVEKISQIVPNFFGIFVVQKNRNGLKLRKKVSSLTRLELTKKVAENIPNNIIKKFVLMKIKNRTIERAVSIQELNGG